jgi:hypothetical protein
MIPDWVYAGIWGGIAALWAPTALCVAEQLAEWVWLVALA